MAINMFLVVLESINPFIIKWFIEFVQNPDEPLSIGVILGISFTVLTLLQSLVNEQNIHYLICLGIWTSWAVTAMIYEKSLKLSSATNKQFEQGEVVNFVQIDANKIYDLSFAFPDVSKFPFLLIYSLIMAYYYFKWTLYGGILLLLVSTITNYFLARW